MGLFLRQDEQRSEVQKRVAAELQERLRQSTSEQPEVDPAFLENQHTTRPAGAIIGVLLFLLCIALVAFALRLS